MAKYPNLFPLHLLVSWDYFIGNWNFMPALTTLYAERSNEITGNPPGAVDIINKLVINAVYVTRDNLMI
jgi:hypothetical protein